MALTKRKREKKQRGKRSLRRAAQVCTASVTDTSVWIDGACVEVRWSLRVDAPGGDGFVQENAINLDVVADLDLLVREMAAFGVILASWGGLQAACESWRGKSAALPSRPDFDGLCGEIVFGADGWKPTPEQALKRPTFYDFYLPGEVFQEAGYADAMPPARDMDREEAYRVLQGEAEFHPSMVKPRSRDKNATRQVTVRRYDRYHVTTPHRTYTEFTRELSVTGPDGGTVQTHRELGLFSMGDVQSLVREFAAFGVALDAVKAIPRACDQIERRSLDVPLGSELNEMSDAPTPLADEFVRLLPWMEMQ